MLWRGWIEGKKETRRDIAFEPFQTSRLLDGMMSDACSHSDVSPRDIWAYRSFPP